MTYREKQERLNRQLTVCFVIVVIIVCYGIWNFPSKEELRNLFSENKEGERLLAEVRQKFKEIDEANPDTLQQMIDETMEQVEEYAKVYEEGKDQDEQVLLKYREAFHNTEDSHVDISWNSGYPFLHNTGNNAVVIMGKRMGYHK